MTVVTSSNNLVIPGAKRYLRNRCAVDDTQQFARSGQSPNVGNAIAAARRQQRAGGVERNGNRCIVVERSVLRVARDFDACRWFFVRGEISDWLVLCDINKLS